MLCLFNILSVLFNSIVLYLSNVGAVVIKNMGINNSHLVSPKITNETIPVCVFCFCFELSHFRMS